MDRATSGHRLELTLTADTVTITVSAGISEGTGKQTLKVVRKSKGPRMAKTVFYKIRTGLENLEYLSSRIILKLQKSRQHGISLRAGTRITGTE